ncbi:SWIM zinc finger family protein [Paenibacillus sp. CGMCC 1.16610]|uniref:SWIM zinc finger family protein n=1 Tax=Paenibacillus anseongense TaxID=2682845 RepID=A0ABW9UFB5_9BACL|nr:MULTISPECIES: SWIM zinc finger family protein [Paenibacillus]MBA2944151.1 SWIM zinc finger family protein [Paenibacillus sp. CGMCC 1.16610]MVQ38041.1 SWIM zinc finger family protein [Paenibacillus anseongense]
MNHLTEAYVDSLAQNSSAIKNGKDLVKKNSFPLLCQSDDGTIIFGECKGSGKEPYRCSIDWQQEGNPVFRCTCPSRQFPCKHNLGLMYAFTSGKTFLHAPIPPDILDKREKAEKREEKKKAVDPEAPTAKRKTNKSALLKKIAAQLEGISIAEKLILQLVSSGLGSLDKKALQTADEQTKQLGNYYIPGIQSALKDLTLQFRVEENREAVYAVVIEQLTTLQSLIKKSREYLNGRLENPDLPIDAESTLEEWIGHAWQMAELREQGRVRAEAQLLQLAFRSYTDQARGEFIDEGYWSDLENGQIHLTRTYRPFRAAKHIREEDSIFQVVQIKELAQYPGELNRRVRWEEATFRTSVSQDFNKIYASAQSSFPEVIKQVKNVIKNPLSDKHPVMLLRFTEIRKTDADSYVLLDEQGKQLPLADIQYLNETTTNLLPMLNKALLTNQAILVMFEQNWKFNRLEAQPLSIVTANEVVRLLY